MKLPNISIRKFHNFYILNFINSIKNYIINITKLNINLL